MCVCSALQQNGPELRCVCQTNMCMGLHQRYVNVPARLALIIGIRDEVYASLLAGFTSNILSYESCSLSMVNNGVTLVALFISFLGVKSTDITSDVNTEECPQTVTIFYFLL